ncbi:MAG: cytochrome P450 [Xanthobacteraceae bacterium]
MTISTPTVTDAGLAAPPRGSNRPPGPKGLPLLGSLLALGRDPIAFFTDCSRQYGGIVSFRLAGWPTVFISDPDIIEIVLVGRHKAFAKARFFWRNVTAIFGKGLLTSEGDFWQRQRRLIAPAFNTARLASYGEAMVTHTQRMLDTWQPGEVRNVHSALMGLTLGIATKTLFDHDVSSEAVQMDRDVATLAKEIDKRTVRPFYIPDFVPLPGNIRFHRALGRIERLVTRIIRSRHGEDRGDLLSILLSVRDDDGNGMSERQLRDEVITLLLAGHETTALALSWTFYLLSQHPEAEAKLGEELQRVLGGRPPTVADLPQLRHAEQVVTEAMRLYPPAWAINRETVEDCELGGYRIPAGTTIIISPWVEHHDPRYFENPEEFRPERWAGDLARQLPRFAYMPFGGGPRICIGNRFSMMEAVLILATMAQRFSLRWQSDHPIVLEPSITLRPGGGVWVRCEQRPA